MRDNTLVNETRSGQAWMHLYLDENERSTEIGGKE